MTSLYSSKFVKLLKTFSEEELKSFGIWLNSPWCNTNKNLITLLEKLKKYHPEFVDPKFTKEKLSKKVMPEGKFSEKRINNLLSEAFLAAEKFTIFQSLEQKQNLQKDLLTKEFQNRNLNDWFFKEINKEIEQIEKKEIKDWEDHLYLMQLNRRFYHHPNQNPRMQNAGKTIANMGEQLNLLYLLEMGTIINEKIFRTRLLKNENHDVETDLKAWQVASTGVKNPSIDLYKMRLNNTGVKSFDEYLRIKKEFLRVHEELNAKEQKVHLIALLNDSTRFYKQKLIPLKDFLPLYKIGLKTEVLFNNGKLSTTTYVAIVSASNISKDFEYTEEFIKIYTQKLNPSSQLDAESWATAHVFYRTEKLNNSLDVLISHNFRNNFFLLLSKLLTTQLYFDLFLKDDSYSDYLFNYFDSFEKWVIREKFRSANSKKSYLRFIQLTRILAKSYSQFNFDSEKIVGLLENEGNVQAVGWIAERIKKIIRLKIGRLS